MRFDFHCSEAEERRRGKGDGDGDGMAAWPIRPRSHTIWASSLYATCPGLPSNKQCLSKKTRPQFTCPGDRLGQCSEAPPAAAFGAAIDPAKGYFVEEISDGIYWLTDGSYTIMFITTGVGVIVVDAPPSLGPKILQAISEVTAEPITHVIYGHSHADHIASASIYPPGALYIAHEDTLSQLTRSRPFPFGIFVGGGPVPLPSVTFTGDFGLVVGDKTVILSDGGLPAHDRGNLFVFLPDQKVLMYVDVIFPGWSPFLSFAYAEDWLGFIEAHDAVLSFDFEHLIAGHLNRLGSRSDVENQKDYILSIQANTVAALSTVDFFAIGQQTGFENPWVFFKTYLDSVAQFCTDRTLEQGWGQVLGGVDVFTFSHCHMMAAAIRIH